MLDVSPRRRSRETADAPGARSPQNGHRQVRGDAERARGCGARLLLRDPRAPPRARGRHRAVPLRRRRGDGIRPAPHQQGDTMTAATRPRTVLALVVLAAALVAGTLTVAPHVAQAVSGSDDAGYRLIDSGS